MGPRYTGAEPKHDRRELAIAGCVRAPAVVQDHQVPTCHDRVPHRRGGRVAPPLEQADGRRGQRNPPEPARFARAQYRSRVLPPAPSGALTSVTVIPVGGWASRRSRNAA
jgi:hypothetical protein